VDGVFGAKTEAATLAFQKARGLTADGIIGPNTWSELTK
jgi:peptidoglycan hydrolase-like protein with peptidoglycan-binding domain